MLPVLSKHWPARQDHGRRPRVAISSEGFTGVLPTLIRQQVGERGQQAGWKGCSGVTMRNKRLQAVLSERGCVLGTGELSRDMGASDPPQNCPSHPPSGTFSKIIKALMNLKRHGITMGSSEGIGTGKR